MKTNLFFRREFLMSDMHVCSEKETIVRNTESINQMAANVSAVTTSVQVLIQQVSRLTDLFERSAISENEIKNIRIEQQAQWKRIDKTVDELKIVSESVRDTVKAVEHLQKDFNDALKGVKGKLEKLGEENEAINEKINELKQTPGKIVLGYVKHMATVILTVLITVYLTTILKGGGG
jgi:chromosome segregation ATPase